MDSVRFSVLQCSVCLPGFPFLLLTSSSSSNPPNTSPVVQEPGTLPNTGNAFSPSLSPLSLFLSLSLSRSRSLSLGLCERERESRAQNRRPVCRAPTRVTHYALPPFVLSQTGVHGLNPRERQFSAILHAKRRAFALAHARLGFGDSLAIHLLT